MHGESSHARSLASRCRDLLALAAVVDRLGAPTPAERLGHRDEIGRQRRLALRQFVLRQEQRALTTAVTLAQQQYTSERWRVVSLASAASESSTSASAS